MRHVSLAKLIFIACVIIAWTCFMVAIGFADMSAAQKCSAAAADFVVAGAVIGMTVAF